MIFNAQQIEHIMKVMDRYAITFVAHRIGPSVLTSDQKHLLRSHGFDVGKIQANSSTVDQAFKFGLLTQALGDYATKNMSFTEFQKYLASGKMVALNQLEQRALENLRFQTYNDTNKLFSGIKNDFSDALVHADKINNTVTHASVVTDAAEQAIRNRKGVQDVISTIGHKTGKWETDLGRISDFVMHTAFDEGRAQGIIKNQGGDALVYKDVYPGACNHCIQAYLTGGISSEPKLFKLSQLQGNGTNVGKKVADWKPVIGPLHPWCRCTLMAAPRDMTMADLNAGLWKWTGSEFERDMDQWKRKVQRTSKIKVTVNGKTTEI